MPSREYRRKAATRAEARERETAEIVRRFLADENRTQIANALKLAESTVSDRLEAAGFPKEKACRGWTETENAHLRECAKDPNATAAAIANHFPGRSVAVLKVKLRVTRLALGIRPQQRVPRPHEAKTPVEQSDDCPDWPLPPGAMRDRHGITLPRISIQMGANHG